MVRGRRTKAKRRRAPKTLKLLGIAEAMVQGSIVTQELADVNLLQFVAGDAGPSWSVAGGGISISEIAKRPELLATMGERLMKPDAVIGIAVKSAVANMAFRFGRKALRRPINLMNRTVFRPLALGVSL